jgi:subfamily B ATP-binding cassette protein MsbA
VHQGLAGAERVFEILDESPGVKDRPEARVAPRFSRAIEFHDVSFAYGATPVLKGVNLVIRAGEMVALVGISGAGKSTLADLIPRFYDVGSGRVTMDGIDIRDLTLESLRAQIGIVTQHTFLFNDTVRNNIAYGDRNGESKMLLPPPGGSAHDFVLAMRKGYDSMVGESGMQLSGGQRQRLAIARALLKDAPILILDEATSSLDSESERSVQDALEKLMTTRTTLVIAHRCQPYAKPIASWCSWTERSPRKELTRNSSALKEPTAGSTVSNFWKMKRPESWRLCTSRSG